MSFLFKLFLDKREDPENINVKYTRNLKTSVDDTTEEQRVLLEIHEQEQSDLSSSSSSLNEEIFK